MKKVVLLFVMLLWLVSSAVGQSTIVVLVEGIEKIKGTMYIALCANEEQFVEKEKPIIGQIIPIQADMVRTEFNVPEGKYAIITFQDENSNGKLDKNIFGVPKERYGFSNNVFGPHGSKPAFSEALFDVGENVEKEVVILLRR